MYKGQEFRNRAMLQPLQQAMEQLELLYEQILNTPLELPEPAAKKKKVDDKSDDQSGGSCSTE